MPRRPVEVLTPDTTSEMEIGARGA
jgi:hypothetical protein